MANPGRVHRSEPRRPRLLARRSRLGALTVAVAALVSAPGAAAESGISVRLPQHTEFVSADRISSEADVAPRDYTLRAQPGEQGEVNTYGGLSVRKLIQLAGASPDTVGFVQVPRADGTSAYLRGADLADPPPFPEGPALVFADGGAIRYFRPVRGPGDANAADNIATVSGDELTVSVHTGSLLTVSARADRAAPHARQTVGFTAIATGAAPGEQLHYRWEFDDGATAGGASARHAYRAAGSYAVIVSVSGSRDSGGSSSVLRVQVGDPLPARGRGAGGSGTGKHAPGSGPVTGGQGRSDAGGGKGGSGTSPGEAAGGGASGPSAPVPAATPAGPAGPPSAAPQPQPAGRAARRKPAARPESPAVGTQVHGILLSAAAARAVAPAAAAQGTKAAARAGTGPPSGVGAPAGGALALALVGLGAVVERRRVASALR